MKATPLLPSEELHRKGLLDFSPSPFTGSARSNLKLSDQSRSSLGVSVTTKADLYVASPSPSPAAGASSSTLCCSSPNSGEIACGERCSGGGMGAEEGCWEAIFPEAAASSPGQEQSILRFMMGDIEDPSLGLSKLLHISSASQDMEFCGGSGGFGFMDPQSLAFDGPNGFMGTASLPDLPVSGGASSGRQVSSFPLFSDSAHSTVMPFHLSPTESPDEKPQILNLQSMINHNQIQFHPNPLVATPSFNPMQDDHPLSSSSGPPPPKRLNSGNAESNSIGPSGSFLGSGQLANHQLPRHHSHLQLHQRPAGMVMKQQQKVAGEELANNQQQQSVIDHLYKVAELIKTGNPVLAQGILARLNQQLYPVGKSFSRAAFYCKEALQSLLHHHHPHLVSPAELPPLPHPPLGLIYKIGAYKSFCEISPVVQFANFTCNQAFLEALDGFSLVHILSFDVGFGGEWASLMHELVLRNGGPPGLLRITSFAFPGIHDELEFGLTEETLKNLAHELNMALEFKVVSINSLNSVIQLCSDCREAIVVNLPIASFSGYDSVLPAALRLIKQLSPKIVVSLDRGCDHMDTPFPNCVVHTLQCYSSLLESLDAVNVNPDVLQKIERYLIQPAIERIMNGQQQAPEKTISWRSLFFSCGFSPMGFSNFNESQAECIVQRSLARGFHVEKKQSSLVLCWQREELVSASVWR
ncbi:hypothetical protein SAY87_014607 [Trapa incisa]|uniref:Scarecrow-like protein 6 n=1 Tax=Trapa incisa TaxID=236973 RepID=A0AAN7GNW2_9MYRT|nr:hypothetical protein SAY87_014607 [Trapa incisa]